MPWIMYRSVGKLSRSDRITRRPGLACCWMRSAAASALKMFSEVVSVMTTSPLPAPIRPASLSPRRAGRSNQPAVFQLRMRPAPHSLPITSAARAAAVLGSTPSELPSR